MSREALEAVIGRAVMDEAFRLALFADPDATLAPYELNEGEVMALKMLDAESLEAFASGSGSRVVRKLKNHLQSPNRSEHSHPNFWKGV